MRSWGGSIQTIGVIPARYQSVRFPGKLLADLGGTPVLLHVFNRAKRAGLARVVVATDDRRIESMIRSAGGEVVMTSPDCRTGTDRIAAALSAITSAADSPDDVVVNIQGDEPFIEPELIAEVAGALSPGGPFRMATAAAPASAEERDDPNAVKVVLDQSGRALYFSRAPIPALGAGRQAGKEAAALRHIGLYAYTRELLQEFVSWPPGVLESIESLEQLRALERGVAIRVIIRPSASFGIDTPADLAKAEAFLKSR